MKQLNLLIAFLALNFTIFGQADTSQKKPLLQLNSFGIRAGGGGVESFLLYQPSYIKMAPGNSLASFDTTRFKSNGYPRGGLFDVGAYITCKPTGISRARRLLFGLAFSFQSSAINNIEYIKKDSIGQFPYDLGNGNVIMRDSFDIYEYKFSYHSQSILLDIFSTYNFIHKPLFRLYAGINAAVGMSFSNYVLVQYNHGSENYHHFSEYFPPKFKYDQQEKTKLNDQLLLNYGIPLGVVLKFHKKENGFAFNPEIRFGGRVTKFQNQSLTNKGYFLLNLGFRYIM